MTPWATTWGTGRSCGWRRSCAPAFGARTSWPGSGATRSRSSPRRLLVEALKRAGFSVEAPQGTYFALADITPLGGKDDVEFCRRLAAEARVATIPVSAFYHERSGGRSYVLRRPPLHKRANSDETMRREARMLAALRGSAVTSVSERSSE